MDKLKVFIILVGFVFGSIFIACKGPTQAKYNDPNPPGGNPASVTAVTPTTAFLMDTVTITGSGFKENSVHDFVRFGNKPAKIVSASSNELKVIVPVGSDDTVQVRVAVQGAVEWSNGQPFIFKKTINVLDEEIVHPCGVAVDKNGNVYVGGREDSSIFKITPSGEKSVFVGNIAVNGALHFGPDNFLYVCEQNEGKIVRITLDGQTIEDYMFADSPIDFDWDGDGTLYIVSNWEGIYKKISDDSLQYVVENENIKTIRIFQDKVYAGASWANQGLRFDITASGLENEETIINADDLVLGLDIDVKGNIYYGLYSDPTLHLLYQDGSQGSMYDGLLTSPMRFMTFFGKNIYAVNTGGGDVGVVLKMYVAEEGAPRYGVD